VIRIGFGNSHRECEELLTEHLDGRLDETRQAKLDAHLVGCKQCRLELRELQALHALLHAQPLAEAPRSFALPYAPRQAEPTRERFSFLRGMQVATASAAVLLVALIGADLVGGGQRDVVGIGEVPSILQSAQSTEQFTGAPIMEAEAGGDPPKAAMPLPAPTPDTPLSKGLAPSSDATVEMLAQPPAEAEIDVQHAGDLESGGTELPPTELQLGGGGEVPSAAPAGNRSAME